MDKAFETIPETWKPVVGFEELYDVSTHGRVRRSMSYRSTFAGKLLKHKINDKGYHSVTLCSKGKSFWRQVHRLVAHAFIPNPEAKPTVNHENGIHGDNTVWNLSWATLSEQMLHNSRVLGNSVGVRHGMAKLTPAIADDIRNAFTGQHGDKSKLARKYNVSVRTICGVINGERWKGQLNACS